MNRYTWLCLLATLFAVDSSRAGIVISSRSVPTPELPGFTTHTVTATSTVPGELIHAADFAGDKSNDPATGRGFFGPMNQVNPAGMQTIFDPFDECLVCGVIGPDWRRRDSHFLAKAREIVVPAGFAEESPHILQAIWAWPQPVGQSLDFAQLVVPNAVAAVVNYRGVFAVTRGGTIVDLPEISGVIPIPEPATSSLVGLALLALVGLVRRTR
jgi:hypothetical protein